MHNKTEADEFRKNNLQTLKDTLCKFDDKGWIDLPELEVLFNGLGYQHISLRDGIYNNKSPQISHLSWSERQAITGITPLAIVAESAIQKIDLGNDFRSTIHVNNNHFIALRIHKTNNGDIEISALNSSGSIANVTNGKANLDGIKREIEKILNARQNKGLISKKPNVSIIEPMDCIKWAHPRDCGILSTFNAIGNPELVKYALGIDLAQPLTTQKLSYVAICATIAQAILLKTHTDQYEYLFAEFKTRYLAIHNEKKWTDTELRAEYKKQVNKLEAGIQISERINQLSKKVADADFDNLQYKLDRASEGIKMNRSNPKFLTLSQEMHAELKRKIKPHLDDPKLNMINPKRFIQIENNYFANKEYQFNKQTQEYREFCEKYRSTVLSKSEEVKLADRRGWMINKQISIFEQNGAIADNGVLSGITPSYLMNEFNKQQMLLLSNGGQNVITASSMSNILEINENGQFQLQKHLVKNQDLYKEPKITSQNINNILLNIKDQCEQSGLSENDKNENQTLILNLLLNLFRRKGALQALLSQPGWDGVLQNNSINCSQFFDIALGESRSGGKLSFLGPFVAESLVASIPTIARDLNGNTMHTNFNIIEKPTSPIEIKDLCNTGTNDRKINFANPLTPKSEQQQKPQKYNFLNQIQSRQSTNTRN